MVRLLCIGGVWLALALGAAGCGGDDEDTGGASGSGTTTAAAQDEITIRMKDFAFDPRQVDAKVGQTITWVNEDDAPHNAVQQNGGDLKTETFEKDGSDSYTVDEAGTIEYICTVHPQMTGTITVTE